MKEKRSYVKVDKDGTVHAYYKHIGGLPWVKPGPEKKPKKKKK